MGKDRRINTQRKVEGSRILGIKDYLLIGGVSLGLTGGISWLFYDSWWGILSSCMVIPLVYRTRKKRKIKEEKKQLSMEFREYMYLVSNALAAGYSPERAFLSGVKEMGDSPLCKSLWEMENRLSLKESLENILLDFASENNVEDIQNFVDVFCYAKRCGGDFLLIIQTTINKISDKLEILDEIEIVMAEKKLEQKIMSMVPMGILLFFRITSAEFMSVLYGNALGICVMSIGLLLYGFAFWLGEKLVEIKV